MKAVIYCRKSSESAERQVMSLDAQVYELTTLAERKGYTVVEIIAESMSAKDPGRPEFNRMIQKIASGAADTILCWKLDRLARNPIDGGQIQWLLQQNKLSSIITPERTYLPEDNVLLMSVEFGMSNQYVRDLSTNVKRGNREKLRRGEWPNHAPYGYRNNKNTKTLEIAPEEARIVRMVYEHYVTGSYSFRMLSKHFDIRKSLVERILSKTFYYGLMERNGEYFKGNHPPIISKDLYDTAQQVKTGATVTYNTPKHLTFPYRGFLQCAKCGCKLTATRKKGKYDYYYCTNGKGVCDQHRSYLTKTQTDKLLQNALRRLHLDETIIDIMYQAAYERTVFEQQDAAQHRNAIDQTLTELERKTDKLLNAYLDSLIAEPVYQKKLTELQQERRALEQQRTRLSLTIDQKLATLEPTKQKFIRCNKRVSEFKKAKPERKRKIAESLLWNLEIQDKKALKYKYKSPYQELADMPRNADLATLLPDRDSNPDFLCQKQTSYL